MDFNSLAYALFFPAVVALYWALQGRLRAQNLLLLVASYFFYGWWDYRFLALIAASSLLDFFVGIGLSGAGRTPRTRKALLALSLVANLGLLGFFKYYNFFVESAQVALGSLGLHTGDHTLAIILPVGISFYTFQTISYSVDMYRGRMQATRDPVAFLAFVSFFPQLVAGPIERAEDLLPQFLEPRTPDGARIRDGLRQALWGMAKKVLIADSLATPVEYAFAHSDTLGGGALLVASTLFLVQLYCDFSGYSDIAIGCANILGFRLTQNFAYPLFSRSFTEFWQRWHITLGTFLRDYLFLELEMRVRRRHLQRRRALPEAQRPPRAPPIWKTATNLLIVFAVSGLWHGAQWTFVVWGALNGLYLVAELVQRRTVDNHIVAYDTVWPTGQELRQMLLVNGVLVFTVVLFRATSLPQALGIYASILTSPLTGLSPTTYLLPCLLAAFPLAIEWWQRRQPHALAALANRPQWVRWTVYYALFFAIILRGGAESRTFVYFQF